MMPAWPAVAAVLAAGLLEGSLEEVKGPIFLW
jgi:hypothetical protein